MELPRYNKNTPAVSAARPIALIMAGYNKVDFMTKRMLRREIQEAYDGDELYIGKNKFLIQLGGKPILQYVLDAVYNARIDGKRIYDHVYIYNDVESFRDSIDLSQYPGITVLQMKDSVAGHWKDFYHQQLAYGQRVDLFFGDTPRLTSEDVAHIHAEYNRILGIERDHRGATVWVAFGVVEYDDMKIDNWLPHRIKFVRRGSNKGKLRTFVSFEQYEARIGNSIGLLKNRSMDVITDNEVINFGYNLRKALTPSSFSKIMYYLWKTKHADMIMQVKRKCINETSFIDTIVDVFSKLYKMDISAFGVKIYHIKKNAARWENDIDGPRDYEVFKRKYREIQQQDRP